MRLEIERLQGEIGSVLAEPASEAEGHSDWLSELDNGLSAQVFIRNLPHLRFDGWLLPLHGPHPRVFT